MPPPIAAIFDLDGLLIDSEPVWRRTEIEVFATVGVVLTEAMCETTTGLRIDEVVAHWYTRMPWPGADQAAITGAIVDRMVERMRSEGVALPGAKAAIETCARAGLRLAVASSSPTRLIEAALDRLGARERFEIVVSAEHERFGKPHPAVYLTTAERLGVAPTDCLALEDSLNGVLAAKSARMTCLAVPAAHDRADRRFAIADRVLSSLEELDPATLGRA